MKDVLTTEEWIRAIKALLFLNKDSEESDIDVDYVRQLIEESIASSDSRYIATVRTTLEDIQNAYYSGKQVFLRLSDETDERPTMIALSRITSDVAEFVFLDPVEEVLEVNYINQNGHGYSTYDLKTT